MLITYYILQNEISAGLEEQIMPGETCTTSNLEPSSLDKTLNDSRRMLQTFQNGVDYVRVYQKKQIS